MRWGDYFIFEECPISDHGASNDKIMGLIHREHSNDKIYTNEV